MVLQSPGKAATVLNSQPSEKWFGDGESRRELVVRV